MPGRPDAHIVVGVAIPGGPPEAAPEHEGDEVLVVGLVFLFLFALPFALVHGGLRPAEVDHQRVVDRPLGRHRVAVRVVGLDVVGDRRAQRGGGRDLGAVTPLGDLLHLAPQELGCSLRAIGEDHLVELQVGLDTDGDRDGAPLLPVGDRLVNDPGRLFVLRRAEGSRPAASSARAIPRAARARRWGSGGRGGGRRGGRRAFGLVEGVGQLGGDQRLGEVDRRLDLQRLLELLDAEIALLEPGDDHDPHVNVGARRDGVLLQPRRVREVERLLEDLAGIVELLSLERRHGVLVHLGDLRDRVVLRVGAGSGRQRKNEEKRAEATQQRRRGRPRGHAVLASGGGKGKAQAE